MTRSIVHLGVGQGGCTLGFEFWKTIAQSHGIDSEGCLLDTFTDLNDRKDLFFYQADDSHFVPRSVFIDLEPRVIDQIKIGAYSKLFNHESCLVYGDGGGAGNSWPKGYDSGNSFSDEILENINREAEATDSLQGFMMTHSLAGGTGSGLGSLLLEKISDHFPKKIQSNFSIFPNSSNVSDTAVQPYNVTLALKRLALYSDAVFVIDNAALDRVASRSVDLKQTNFSEVNQLAAAMMASATSTMRFPDYMNTDLVSLLASLIPTPRCHFISSAYTPFAPPTSVVSSRPVKTSVQDIISRLINPKNSLVTYPQKMYKSTECYISMLNIVEGDVEAAELNRDLQRVRASSDINFISWAPAGIQVALARRSPYSPSLNRLSGCMLANYTGVRHLLSKSVNDVTKMIERKAFLTSFENILNIDITSELMDAVEVLRSLVTEYKKIESPNYAKDYINSF